jgi:hypothetical protein
LEVVKIRWCGCARGDVNDAAPPGDGRHVCRLVRQTNSPRRDSAIADQDDKTTRIR